MSVKYLDDFAVGQTFGSGRLVVDKEQIKSFASDFDPQPFHLDEKAAQDTIFRGLAASGWHTAAVTMRLLVESELKPAGGIVGAGFDEFRWPRPVRPGDELRLESEVLEVRPSRSRPDQGLIKVRTTTLNQNDDPVQILVANLVVMRVRPMARGIVMSKSGATMGRRWRTMGSSHISPAYLAAITPAVISVSPGRADKQASFRGPRAVRPRLSPGPSFGVFARLSRAPRQYGMERVKLASCRSTRWAHNGGRESLRRRRVLLISAASNSSSRALQTSRDYGSSAVRSNRDATTQHLQSSRRARERIAARLCFDRCVQLDARPFGRFAPTPDRMTLDELEGCINALQDELDVLRAEARRTFTGGTGYA